MGRRGGINPQALSLQIYMIIPDFPISMKVTFDNVQWNRQMGGVLQMLQFAQV